VKRLLPYIILAFASHAILLSTDVSWLRFAPGTTSAAKSLSITLSANMPQTRKAQAAVPQKPIERQLEPRTHQKPIKNPDSMPAPAQAKQPAQLQKPLPAAPPKIIIKKARWKKSLKALTYKKQRIKPIEATPAANETKRHLSPKSETTVFHTASTLNKPVHHPLPADAASIKKTQRVPAGSAAPATTAAVLPDTQSDDSLSGAVLKLARPLYKQNTAPPYPRKARRLGYEGIVMLKVLIDKNGRVEDLTVLKSSGHTVLDRAALSAVRNWLFEPGTEGGIKKKMWVKIPLRFDLK
jgi:protein TonB